MAQWKIIKITSSSKVSAEALEVDFVTCWEDNVTFVVEAVPIVACSVTFVIHSVTFVSDAVTLVAYSVTFVNPCNVCWSL